MSGNTLFSVVSYVLLGVTYCMEAGIVFHYSKSAIMDSYAAGNPQMNGFNPQQPAPQNGYNNNTGYGNTGYDSGSDSTAPPQ